MKKMVLAALACVAAVPMAPALARDVYVKGYVRSDGAYVAPHYRSAPDNNPYNNYSTYPNTNPYTGRQGTSNPYYIPRSYSPPSYSAPRYDAPTYNSPYSGYGGYGGYSGSNSRSSGNGSAFGSGTFGNLFDDSGD